MSRRRFFVPRERILGDVASLPPDQAHHLRDVLRLAPGDEVEIFDGEGNGYTGRVEADDSGVHVALLKKLPQAEAPGVSITLAPALIKADRFEWLLQKATELGADEIVPLSTRFSQNRIPSGRLGARLERWERIVREASKQCRRLTVPHVREPMRFTKFLEASLPPPVSRLLLYEKAPACRSSSFVPAARVLVCTGPEGGWDVSEVEAAQQAGFQVFGLGPRILRAETAAIAALAIIQFNAGSEERT